LSKGKGEGKYRREKGKKLRKKDRVGGKQGGLEILVEKTKWLTGEGKSWRGPTKEGREKGADNRCKRKWIGDYEPS